MGFKLPGKSIHAGTTAHSSALKMAQQEQDAAARLRAQQFGQAQGVDNNMDLLIKRPKRVVHQTSGYFQH